MKYSSISDFFSCKQNSDSSVLNRYVQKIIRQFEKNNKLHLGDVLESDDNKDKEIYAEDYVEVIVF